MPVHEFKTPDPLAYLRGHGSGRGLYMNVRWNLSTTYSLKRRGTPHPFELQWETYLK